MPDFDRQALLNIFATEASDGLLTLASALDSRGGSLPTPQSLLGHFIGAHGLTGSAGLYGFMGCAHFAKILAGMLEQADRVADDEWPRIVASLREIVTALRKQIAHINQEGVEDPAIFDALTPRDSRAMSEVDMRPATVGPDHASSQVLIQELEPALPSEAMAETMAESVARPSDYYIPSLEAEVLEFFVPEAQEYLDAVTSCLLGLEQNPDDQDRIHKLFRVAHTLKGAALTVGFQVIGDLTHYMEDIIGAIREGRMRVTTDLTDLFFRAVDMVRLLLGREPGRLADMRRDFDPIMQRLRLASSGSAEEAVAVPSREETSSTAPALMRAETPAAVLEEKAPARSAREDAAGTVRVSRDRLERLLNLVGELVIGRSRLERRIAGLEQLSHQVLAYKGRMLEAVRTFEKNHTFTLPSQSNQAPVGQAPAGPSSTGGILGQSPLASAADFGSLEFDNYNDFNVLARRMTEGAEDVGEAITQLNASIRKAREDMGLLQQLTTDLRDEIARTRMAPIGALFTRFQRAVREMARTAGKPVDLIFAGADTEVDAGIVQRLADPLIHLMRNAVAHGIESPDARAAAGKPDRGAVYLSAFHRGNQVIVEIEDDGAGLNVDKIKTTAVALGLLRPERAATMPPSEIMDLIYLPGFSTADEVGDQSGRGVGMDVVKRAITDMNGRIEIETESGVGTKFTLSLPLTLLISTALMVRAGDQQYALPLPAIREILVPPAGAVADISGKLVLQAGAGDAIEIKSLAQLLGVAPAPRVGRDDPDAERPVGTWPVVMIQTPKGLLGLAVDGLLGLREIVLKTLGSLRLFQGSCYSGATIDPEGRVVLVVDPANLLGGTARAPVLSDRAALQDVLRLEMGDDADGRIYQGEDAGVLLVDDSLSVRKFIGRMLEGAGYTVQTAADGEEGLRKASAESFRMIITDLEMPKMNGYELIQALRDRPETRTTPIIIMTTRAGDKHRQVAQSMGVSSYITKPVEERALIREISQYMSSRSGAARP